MSHLQRSTFTVTNLSPLGLDSFSPVSNPPEVAILGVNRVRERVVPDGNDGDVAVRRRMTVDLTFDHRPLDGADAARFLETLADRVHNAETLVDACSR
ncbi:2-oxo acid dehydrogenase subunit E2 [Natronolimnobius sp. AArcel1]|uniref:2-oxo acid dehydrogenase subunit E2 n=1 Tax=Natronolimnobius sp. AArcel1 TaxID=1679093 RepID=UPI0013ECD2E7|nr:2-oxo acid dehydrogenase subunit E2 [Natronolimnobius sp. AArcel1]NGM70572.1 2-oxo acid dehydrogenase subunit E2 [Natronolimnobius sp. AArcel1]